MRKHLVGLFLALAILLSAVTASAAVLIRNQEQVGFTVTEQGDPAAAEGFSVTSTYHLQNHAFWDTDYVFGKAHPASTRFQYRMKPRQLEEQVHVPMPMFSCGLDYVNQIHWEYVKRLVAKDGIPEPSLLPAWQALYDSTPVGKVSYTYVKAADYFDYYPLNVQIYLGEGGLFWDLMDRFYGHKTDGIQAFDDYFRIPVLPEEQLLLEADRRLPDQNTEDALSSAWHEPRGSADFYPCNGLGTVLGDRVYFTLDFHTEQGKLVDFSRIPGGPGLYTMAEGADYGPDMDSLTTLIPLDPAYTPLSMEPQPGHDDRILYYGEKEGTTYVMVLDVREGKLLQTLPILEGEEEVWQWYRTEGRELYAVSSGQSIQVFRQNDQGLYEPQVRVLCPEDGFRWHNLMDSDFACLDDRVAVVQNLYRYDPANPDYIQGVAYGFSFTVLGPEGVLYSGDFVSTLDPGPGENSQIFRHRVSPTA